MPNENPIGKPILVGSEESPPSEIVGVVADVRAAGLDSDPRPAFYQSAYQKNWGTLFLAVRTTQDPKPYINTIRSVIRELRPDVPVDKASTGEDVIINSLASPRLAMVLMATFAALALILATVGIYGVMSYTVTQATQEIGVRRALGAQSGDVLRLVLGYAFVLALAGLVIGVPAALALTRLLSTQLFGIAPHDPVTFAAVSALLLAVAVGACLAPALKAMNVDPNVALRYE
jgi:putative ABC transport system permease protein